MFIITIQATTEEDKELLPLFRNNLCYSIADESGLKVQAKGWNGYSGGDDAYFGLMNKFVKVEIDNE